MQIINILIKKTSDNNLKNNGNNVQNLKEHKIRNVLSNFLTKIRRIDIAINHPQDDKKSDIDLDSILIMVNINKIGTNSLFTSTKSTITLKIESNSYRVRKSWNNKINLTIR